MAGALHRLKFGVSGQVLRHTPAVRQASVPWVLEDLTVAEGSANRVLQEGIASPPAVELGTAAIAGPGAVDGRRIDLEDTSGLAIGDEVLLEHVATGEAEVVVITGLSVDAYILAEHRLVATYPAGSLVRGLALETDAIVDAIVEDEDRLQIDEPMRLVWRYPMGYRAQEQVRLVRHDEGDLNIARIRQDLLRFFPDLHTRLLHHGRDSLPGFIAVIRDSLRAHFADSKIRLDQFLAGDQGHYALVWRVLEHLAHLGNTPGTEDPQRWIEYCEREAQRCFNALTIGEGGPEVVELERVQDTALGSEASTYRRRIMPL